VRALSQTYHFWILMLPPPSHVALGVSAFVSVSGLHLWNGVWLWAECVPESSHVGNVVPKSLCCCAGRTFGRELKIV
jgi:hypothetical protein